MSDGVGSGDLVSEEDKNRKMDFTSDEIVWQDLPLKKKKKKKPKKKKDPKLKGNKQSQQSSYSNYNAQTSTWPDIGVVNAKPEHLPSTPQIFNRMPYANQSNLPDTSNLFYLDCIPDKSFSSDIKSRFINFIKACDQNGDNQTTCVNEPVVPPKIKKNAKSRKAQKMDPALQKFRQERAQLKKKARLCDKGFRSYDDILRNINMSRVPVQVPNIVDIYETCVKDTVIFHMHYPSEFSFHGEMRITVIAGYIEILGCAVNESTLSKVDVYCPNFYVPLVIECKDLKPIHDIEEVKTRVQYLIGTDDLNKLLNNLKPNDAILLIEQIKSTFGGVIDLYFHKSLFQKDLVDFSSESESLKSLQCTFNFKSNPEGIRRNPQWDGIPSVHCSIICGGHGVGKSTLLKYLVNKALRQNQKVLCLDFDPGQPEFTPSGCLSAVVVDKPLLGPNFSHMIDPEIMVYFGSVDVAYSPGLYLECVNYIIEKCRKKEELSDYTWFVNTMGFNRGVGVELMTAIIKLVKPNIVIQIRSSDMKLNYPCYFTPRHVNGKGNAWSVLKEDVELSYDLRVVDSFASQGRKSSQGALPPKHRRDFLFFSYFSKMVSPPNYSFNSVTPYMKSFSNLYLAIESLIAPNEILKAFNGSLVSLSHFEHKTEEIFITESETDEYFKIVVKPAVTQSFGLGLVRGINVDEKTIYVLTHLPDEKLSQVNCLSLGRLHTPYSIFLIQEEVKGVFPYTCVSSIDSIQKVNRLFPQPTTFPGNDRLQPF